MSRQSRIIRCLRKDFNKIDTKANNNSNNNQKKKTPLLLISSEMEDTATLKQGQDAILKRNTLRTNRKRALRKLKHKQNF